MEVFLDSGAFSAFTRKTEIHIDEYIDYVKENLEYIDYYANLDVIGDQPQTYKNWVYMRKKGLDPMPVFHAGRNRNPKHLQHYLEEAEYIALGAIAKMNTAERIRNLDNVWYSLTNNEGLPLVKVHGFGLTSFPLMERYPWFSVDSMAWVLQGGSYGHMWFPYYDKDRKEFDFSIPPITADVGRLAIDKSCHFWALSNASKEVVLDYLKHKGFSYGKSEFKHVDITSYRLQEGELWADRASGLVEVVVEKGLCNNHLDRCRHNLCFYIDKYQHSSSDRKFTKRVNPLFGKGILNLDYMKPIDVGKLRIFTGGMDSSQAIVLDEFNYEYRLVSYYMLSQKEKDWLKNYVTARRKEPKNADKEG